MNRWWTSELQKKIQKTQGNMVIVLKILETRSTVLGIVLHVVLKIATAFTWDGCRKTSPSRLPFVPSGLALGSTPTSPNWGPLNPQIKATHPACHFTACLPWHNCWVQIPPAWKCVPLPNHHPYSSFYHKLGGQFIISPDQTSLASPRPLLLGDHKWSLLSSHPSLEEKSPFSFTAPLLPLPTWKSHLYLTPSRWLPAFFINKSRTN